ncbi:MAG TPA: tetratricopeptide repeat protein [Bacteroides sp.]|nr:tetratricopeptide repeat protein [Bacteroides sp.]
MRYVFIAVLLLLALAVNAQDEYTTKNRKAIGNFEKAKQYYLMMAYDNASAALMEAGKADPEFIEAWLLLGQVQTDAGNIEEAAAAYRKAVEIDPLFFPNVLFFLAESDRMLGNYYDARVNYEMFLLMPNTLGKMREAALESSTSCDFAINAVENPVEFEPVNMGPNINSANDEYWPNLSADEKMLVYTMLLPIDVNNPVFRGNRQEDLYFSMFEGDAWQPARNVGPPLNTPDNEGAQSISGNGMLMVFTGCMRDDGYGMCDLYFSENRNGIWTIPRNIGAPVNSKYSEKQPALSSDGRTVYFSSDRPGGLGQFDLWKSTLGDDGKWSRPENMGANINSSGFDQSPFIHPDNKTMYFSSTGWPGMGNYDIFLSRRSSDTSWSEPVNLGYPINTHHSEQGLIVNSRANRAYFSSNRLESMGQDIYYFELYDDARPNRVSYMKGKVYDDETGRPLGAKFELIDLETTKTIISSSSKPETGEFLVVIPVDADYALNVSRPSYLFHSENFAFDKVYEHTKPFYLDIGLKPIKVGESITLRNVFYRTDSFSLDPYSRVELDKVVGMMEKNPSLVIEIGGHTDNIGTDSHNITLSGRRAEEAMNYLASKGIASERITSKGYGMKEPVASNDTEEGKAKNRRTELKILAK